MSLLGPPRSRGRVGGRWESPGGKRLRQSPLREAPSVSKGAEGAPTSLGGKQGPSLSKPSHLEGLWGLRFLGHRWGRGNASAITSGLKVLMIVKSVYVCVRKREHTNSIPVEGDFKMPRGGEEVVWRQRWPRLKKSSQGVPIMVW